MHAPHSAIDVGDASSRVLIGPANFAGQADLLARAAQREISEVRAVSMTVERAGALNFPAELMVPGDLFDGSRAWRYEFFQWVRRSFSHAVIDGGRPMFGALVRGDCFQEARELEQASVVTALLAHGSELRDPEAHAERFPWSPFRDREWSEYDARVHQARSFGERLAQSEAPLLVSTPDLLLDAPSARWCPVVVDSPAAAPERPDDTVTVTHAPSHDRLKGSEAADAAMAQLGPSPRMRYRRVTRVEPRDMPAVWAASDIVLDQFRIGSYGVAAVEAMAHGCAVVGNVTDQVRDHVRDATGVELPVVQARPDEIADVVQDLAADADRRHAVGRSSRAFATRVHSGAASAAALREVLHLGTESNREVT